MGRQVDLRIVAWTRRTQISRHFLNLSVPLNRCLFGTHTRFFFLQNEPFLVSFLQLYLSLFVSCCIISWCDTLSIYHVLFYLNVWQVIHLSRAILSQCLTSYQFLICCFMSRSRSDKRCISHLLYYLTLWQVIRIYDSPFLMTILDTRDMRLPESPLSWRQPRNG